MYHEEHECGCEDQQETIDSIKAFFQGVIENLYGINKLNLVHLEDCLDEIAGYLDMKLPQGNLQVRAIIPTNHLLEEWKVLNNVYLSSLKSKQHAGV